MAKVSVYRFQVFDAATRAWHRVEGYGTAACIAARKGATLFNTKREVEESDLDPAGFFAPRSTVPR